MRAVVVNVQVDQLLVRMSAQKVLVTGPISSLSSYFTKLASLQTKHSFNLVLAQDLFSSIDNDDKDLDDLLDGTIQIPVQVYAAVGKGKLPQKVQDKVDKGEEITTNLSVLRQYTSLFGYPTHSRLTIVTSGYCSESGTTDVSFRTTNRNIIWFSSLRLPFLLHHFGRILPPLVLPTHRSSHRPLHFDLISSRDSF